MKRISWFKSWGWIYIPTSWQGFIALDRNSHSVSDTLYGIFPFVVPCLILLYWVASKTSSPNGKE